MLLETPEPVSDTSPAGSHAPGDGRNGLPLCGQKHHPRSAVKPGLATLSSSDRLKVVPFLLGKLKFHAKIIGKEL
jgi:hypothetical protein